MGLSALVRCPIFRVKLHVLGVSIYISEVSYFRVKLHILWVSMYIGEVS